MNDYIVRFDLDMDQTLKEPFVDMLCEFAIQSTLIVVYENPRGDNPHLHAMFTSEADTKKIRNRLLYLFKKSFKDERAYSIKQKPGNLLYLCKGRLAISKVKDPKYPGEKEYPTVVFNGGYLESDITYNHEEWWRQAKSFKVGKVEKEKKLSELAEMIKYIEKLAIGLDGKLKPDYSEEQLEDDIIDYYIKHRKLIRFPIMIDYINTIWLILLNTYSRPKEYLEYRENVKNQLRRYRENKY